MDVFSNFSGFAEPFTLQTIGFEPPMQCAFVRARTGINDIKDVGLGRAGRKQSKSFAHVSAIADLRAIAGGDGNKIDAARPFGTLQGQFLLDLPWGLPGHRFGALSKEDLLKEGHWRSCPV